MILVTCRTCGHTILFNAITLGVVDPNTGKVKEAKP
jgi:ribosomal protein L32